MKNSSTIGFVIVSRFLTKIFSLGKAQGIVLFPFIFVSERSLLQNPNFLNHERIHCAQALEMGVLPFYLWYLMEYCIKWLRYRNSHKAYLNISFEKEAYQNESDLMYLQNRKSWGFIKYLL